MLCQHWQPNMYLTCCFMNLLIDEFWCHEIKRSHLNDRTHKSIEWSKELMLEIHNGAKYVLEEHFYFFEKFLEMFQTCSVSQKWFRIGSAPYKFSYFLLEMTAVLNLDSSPILESCSNQLSKFGYLTDYWHTPDWLPKNFKHTEIKPNSRL